MIQILRLCNLFWKVKYYRQILNKIDLYKYSMQKLTNRYVLTNNHSYKKIDLKK